MPYECLKKFPADSAWQRYQDGANHEELLEYAIRQHSEKLNAERWREEDQRKAEAKIKRLKERIKRTGAVMDCAPVPNPRQYTYWYWNPYMQHWQPVKSYNLSDTLEDAHRVSAWGFCIAQVRW